MRFFAAVIAALAAVGSAHVAQEHTILARQGRGRCSSNGNTAENAVNTVPDSVKASLQGSIAKVESFWAGYEPEVSIATVKTKPRTTPVNIRTYVHIVSTRAKRNSYPLAMIRNQVNVLNKAWAPWGYKFTLTATTRTINDAWATTSMGHWRIGEIQRKLHKGTLKDLNLYMLSDMSGDTLGFCGGPAVDWQGRAIPDLLTYDGCFNQADSMPGSTYYGFNLGYTAVHEVGHWMGLGHVFDGGCSVENDGIADTPAQAGPTWGCPSPAPVSCSAEVGGGPHSINNFMDYSDDRCMTNFTVGQAARMTDVYSRFRAPN